MKPFNGIATIKHITIMTIIVIIGLTIQSVIFLNIVTAEIPGLKNQIARQDKTIADQQYILEEQAVPAILRLANQVKALGGDPGIIELKPKSSE